MRIHMGYITLSCIAVSARTSSTNSWLHTSADKTEVDNSADKNLQNQYVRYHHEMLVAKWFKTAKEKVRQLENENLKYNRCYKLPAIDINI